MSGASAIHATAGWPNFGKLRASSAPERSARKTSKPILAGAHERLELLLAFEAPRGRLGVVLVRIATDLHAVDARRARGRIEHERGIALVGESLRNGAGGGPILQRDHLHDPCAGTSSGRRLGRGR